MSEDNDCDHEEEQDEKDKEPRQVEMRAGDLFISAEGETTEEAADGAKELWDKAIEDISEMPDDERNRIGLQ